MADVVKVDDLAGEIVLAVKTYTEEVGAAIEEAVKETARALAADLRETSPKKTGEYAKGWTARKEGPGRYVVYNKKKPQLTHLLEHGDRKSTRLNSSHVKISYAVFCLKKKNPTVT